MVYRLRAVSVLLEIRGEKRKGERNTNEQSCTCECDMQSRSPLAGHAHSHASTITSFAFFLTDFRRKKNARSLYGIIPST